MRLMKALAQESFRALKLSGSDGHQQLTVAGEAIGPIVGPCRDLGSDRRELVRDETLKQR